jgi:hypothetical protein
MIRVKPIIPEHWVVNGFTQLTTSEEVDSLYIKPLLPHSEFLVNASSVHHTLILDNNILTDLLENRRPENNRYLETLFRSVRIEMNPVYAMTEQRQKYARASEALLSYAKYMKDTFGHVISQENIIAFESLLEQNKTALVGNIEILSGYLSAIIYLYHLNCSAAEKIEFLSGLIIHSEIPIFQLHFYFAGLVFFAKDRPELFDGEDIKKIKEDMKIAKNFDEQKKKILNLSNDLAMPATAIFQGGIENDVLVFPYIATRDRLCKLFLSQIECVGVGDAGKGRANGIWFVSEGSTLGANFGKTISATLPKRTSVPVREEHLVRKSNLAAFIDLYINKIFEHART